MTEGVAPTCDLWIRRSARPSVLVPLQLLIILQGLNKNSEDESGMPTLTVDTSEENKFDLFDIQKLLIKKENIYLNCIQNSLLYYAYKKGKRKAPHSSYLVRKSTDLDLDWSLGSITVGTEQ